MEQLALYLALSQVSDDMNKVNRTEGNEGFWTVSTLS